MITLVPKGRATFVSVEYCEGGSFHRVEIPKSEFGSGKMGYDDMLDAICHTNGTAQDNEDSAMIEAQVSIEEEPFEVRPEDLDEDLDELIDEVKAIKLPPRRKRSSVAEALETSV